MAHFAELELKTDPSGFTSDEKYIVKRVVVIGNDVPAANGTLEQHDMHEDGVKQINNGLVLEKKMPNTYGILRLLLGMPREGNPW